MVEIETIDWCWKIRNRHHRQRDHTSNILISRTSFNQLYSDGLRMTLEIRGALVAFMVVIVENRSIRIILPHSTVDLEIYSNKYWKLDMRVHKYTINIERKQNVRSVDWWISCGLRSVVPIRRQVWRWQTEKEKGLLDNARHGGDEEVLTVRAKTIAKAMSTVSSTPKENAMRPVGSARLLLLTNDATTANRTTTPTIPMNTSPITLNQAN